jgi:hypothetical protein
MARALTAEWQHIPPADQPEAASRWRARHDSHHWIFRSPTNPDAFLEFIEGADADVLSKARAGAGMNAPVEILTELELS